MHKQSGQTRRRKQLKYTDMEKFAHHLINSFKVLKSNVIIDISGGVLTAHQIIGESTQQIKLNDSIYIEWEYPKFVKNKNKGAGRFSEFKACVEKTTEAVEETFFPHKN